MKRHTTRKKNRRVKRAKVNKLIDRMECLWSACDLEIKSIKDKSGRTCKLVVNVLPTVSFSKVSMDFTVSSDNSEISPTTEY